MSKLSLGTILLISLSQAIAVNSLAQETKDDGSDQLIKPNNAKKIMMQMLGLTWVTAIIVSIMFVCCGLDGYSKTTLSQQEEKREGEEENSSLIQEDKKEGK